METCYVFFADEVKQEVVTLSTRSGVLSRYTALVATDQDGKTLPKVNLKMDEEEEQNYPGSFSTLYKNKKSKKAVSRSRGGSRSRSSQMTKQLAKKSCHSGYCTILSKKKVGSQSKERSRSRSLSPPMTKKLPVESRHCVKQSILGAEQKTASAESADADIFEYLVGHQKFDGSWAKKDIATTFSIDLADLQLPEYEVCF